MFGGQETGFDICSFLHHPGVFSAVCVCVDMIEGMHQQSLQLSKRLQQSADVVNSNWQSPQGAARTR